MQKQPIGQKNIDDFLNNNPLLQGKIFDRKAVKAYMEAFGVSPDFAPKDIVGDYNPVAHILDADTYIAFKQGYYGQPCREGWGNNSVEFDIGYRVGRQVRAEENKVLKKTG